MWQEAAGAILQHSPTAPPPLLPRAHRRLPAPPGRRPRPQAAFRLTARRGWRLSAAAASGEGPGADGASPAPSALHELLAAGRVNKTALGKLGVAALREECAAAGLPPDGTKPVLVERLLAWATAQLERGGAAGSSSTAQDAASQAGAQQEQQQQQQRPGEGAALPAAQANVAAAADSPSAAAAPRAGAGAGAAAAPAAAQAPAAAARAAGGAGVDAARITFLGTSSGNPTSRRNVSCIAVRLGSDVCLVDAGEGSRNQVSAGQARRRVEGGRQR